MEQEDFNSTSVVKIKVLGVGGGGNNAVNRMIDANVSSDEAVHKNFISHVWNTGGIWPLSVYRQRLPGYDIRHIKKYVPQRGTPYSFEFWRRIHGGNICGNGTAAQRRYGL